MLTDGGGASEPSKDDRRKSMGLYKNVTFTHRETLYCTVQYHKANHVNDVSKKIDFAVRR